MDEIDKSANIYIKNVVWKNPNIKERMKNEYFITDFGRYGEIYGNPPFIPTDSIDRLLIELYLRDISIDDVYTKPKEPVTLHVDIEDKPLFFVENKPLSQENMNKLEKELKHFKACAFLNDLGLVDL